MYRVAKVSMRVITGFDVNLTKLLDLNQTGYLLRETTNADGIGDRTLCHQNSYE